MARGKEYTLCTEIVLLLNVQAMQGGGAKARPQLHINNSGWLHMVPASRPVDSELAIDTTYA